MTSKVTAKKVFLLFSTFVVAIACIVYLFVIFDAFEYQQEMADREIGDEIITIHKGVPRGWGYSIVTNENEIGSLGQLGRAVARVDFSLPDLNAKLKGDIEKRTIYFYPKSAVKSVERELENAKKNTSAPCRSELYHQTSAYFIMSSSCDAFQGEKYADIERQLKMELVEFWFKFQ